MRSKVSGNNASLEIFQCRPFEWKVLLFYFFCSTAALWLLLLLLLKTICNPSGNFGSSLLVWSHACMHAYKRQTFSFVSLSRSSIQIIVNIKISICTIGTSLLFAKKSCLRRTLCCRRLQHNSYHCRQLAVIQTYSHICEIQCSCCRFDGVCVCALFFFIHISILFSSFLFVENTRRSFSDGANPEWLAGSRAKTQTFTVYDDIHLICTNHIISYVPLHPFYY